MTSVSALWAIHGAKTCRVTAVQRPAGATSLLFTWNRREPRLGAAEISHHQDAMNAHAEFQVATASRSNRYVLQAASFSIEYFHQAQRATTFRAVRG